MVKLPLRECYVHVAITDGGGGGRQGTETGRWSEPLAQSLLSAFFPELFGDDDSQAERVPDHAGGRRPRLEGVHEGPSDEESLQFVGLYIISVAARLADMHPQTLRKYERFGLIRPSRTAGSLRLYSEEDLLRLKLIRALVEKFDLNLAGVRLALDMVYRVSSIVSTLESSESVMRTREGRTASRELRDLLSFLVAS